MAVPVWSVGQVLAAADVNNWFVPAPAYKNVSLGRTVTVNAADPDLTVPVAANAIYIVELILFYHSTSATGNFTWTWTFPAGSGGNSAGWYTSSAGTVFNGSPAVWNASFKAKVDATPGVTDTVTQKGLFFTGVTSGSLTLSWAGDSSGPTVTLETPSYMILNRVG